MIFIIIGLLIVIIFLWLKLKSKLVLDKDAIKEYNATI